MRYLRMQSGRTWFGSSQPRAANFAYLSRSNLFAATCRVSSMGIRALAGTATAVPQQAG